MTTITIDFAPKGGPSEPLSGTWGSTEAGGATITWPDGNVWPMASAPTAAWQRPTPLDDHQVSNMPCVSMHILFGTPCIYHAHTVHRRRNLLPTAYYLPLTSYHFHLLLTAHYLLLTTRGSSPTLTSALMALRASAFSHPNQP